MKNYTKFGSLIFGTLYLNACGPDTTQPQEVTKSQTVDTIDTATPKFTADVNPEIWPKLQQPALDPVIEARIDKIISQMTLEQKIGQTLQADSDSVTPEEVKRYRLGSVLSGGNSAPGPLPYADTQTWLNMADEYYNASIDPEGVEIAIPVIWGIDAVHGHTNLIGSTIFPHNIGLGAARNPELIEDIMEVTARELLVSGHDWTFAPTLAVPQDDRWGRAFEGFSETPDIVASYSDRIVNGLQGEFGTDAFMANDRILSAAKHFLADGGTFEGKDQGDAKITEEELRDIHGMGYLPALNAQAQTVMVSFSSWNGKKMTGHKPLITDVLKGRMGFQGFVISDWNAHGQVEGCTNADCPQAFNAGIDMFMAPDSWKAMYESLLGHVKSGRISQARLDDAVRRILRVKLTYGLFDKGAPSTRTYSGKTELLGSPAHKDIARQAVRESLVLLKNNNNILPLNAGQTVLIVGDGANNIAKASGGWTLSWQGGTHKNEEFPNGQTILDGIKDAVKAKGGTVIYDPDGSSDAAADVIIAVYGEDAYAEFQGDRSNLDFEPNGFDTERLKSFKARNIPVVSVFLSGRPLWTNPELNNSEAFIAAWLPGSEGAGIADMLFRSSNSYDFKGKLSFSWPKTAVQGELNVGKANYDPLFAYGYGLTYGSRETIEQLSETSGLSNSNSDNLDSFFAAGQANQPWSLYGMVDGTQTRMTDNRWDGGKLTIGGTDRLSQEDSLRVNWNEGGPEIRLSTHEHVDFSRQSNGAMQLAFYAKNFGGYNKFSIGMVCNGGNNCKGVGTLPVTIDSKEWTEHRIALKCFEDAGVDMSHIQEAFRLSSSKVASIGLSDIRLEPNAGTPQSCVNF